MTGGIYFGEPRGIEPIENNERKGINTHTYTTSEIQRVARVAFDLAKKRKNKVTTCEKSIVMEAFVLWWVEVQALKDNEYQKIELSHMLADNFAIIASPISEVETSFMFLDMISFVLKPSSRTL